MEEDVLLQGLSLNSEAMPYALLNNLRAKCPKSYVMETASAWFRPFEYAKEGHCTIKDDREGENEWSCEWDNKEGAPFHQAQNTWLKVKWQKHELQLVTVGGQRHYIIAKTKAAAEAFFTAVCTWVAEIRAEILVFQDGQWLKSEQLYSAIKNASLENLVLPGTMRETIANDFLKFFESKETYAKYGIAWKRGVLFIGPPGNGKTHMVKAVLNKLAKPCIYVRNFNSTDGTPHENIAKVFKRARDTAPCVLVLEDLDSLVDDSNRSFFLNEMDGFYSNEGILTVATTNHPEKLDNAILERPSRFDRKYTFRIPAFEERKRFIELFNESVEPDLQLNPDAILRIAWATKDFSYAYLKELFLSAMMNFMAEDTLGTLGGHMISHLDSLREQMKAAAEALSSANEPPGLSFMRDSAVGE